MVGQNSDELSDVSHRSSSPSNGPDRLSVSRSPLRSPSKHARYSSNAEKDAPEQEESVSTVERADGLSELPPFANGNTFTNNNTFEGTTFGGLERLSEVLCYQKHKKC
jgi:hypothetical protein